MSQFQRLLTKGQQAIKGVVPQINNQSSNSANFYDVSQEHVQPMRQRQLSQNIKQGWLRKPSHMRGWQRRWFVLAGDCLYYYQSDEATSKQHGVVELLDNKTVNLVTSADMDKFMFEVTTDKTVNKGSGETLLLLAESEEERTEWMTCIKQVIYSEKGGAIFGQNLVDTMLYESMTSNRKVPTIVQTCVEFLMEHGLDHEGIFRLSGRSSYIRQLKDLYDRAENPTLDIEEVDVNTVASLFKMYLRELPEPLIPVPLYEDVMKIALRDIKLDPEGGRKQFVDLLLTLPRHSYNLLQYVCHFLHEVTLHADINKMGTKNLATVFHSMIIQPDTDEPQLLMATTGPRTQVVSLLIEEYYTLLCNEYTHRGEAVRIDHTLVSDLSPKTPQFEASAGGDPLAESIKRSDIVNREPTVSMMLDINADDSVFSGKTTDTMLPAPLVPSSIPGSDIGEKPSNDKDISPEKGGTPIPPKRKHRRSESNSSRTSSNATEDTMNINVNSNGDAKDSDVFSAFTECGKHGMVRSQTMKLPGASAAANDSHVLLRSSSEKIRTSRPKPLPRPRVLSNNRPVGIIDIESSAVSDTEEDGKDGESVSEDDTLFNQQTETFTLEQLKEYSSSLIERLKIEKKKCGVLRETLNKARDAHRHEVQTLEMRVEKERVYNNNAIERMEQLQLQLQEYKIKYGEVLGD